MMTVPTCGDAGGRTSDGVLCRVTLGIGESGLCRMHDPTRAAEAQAIRSAGGRASGAARRKAKAALPEGVPRTPKTISDAVTWSAWAIYQVATGGIDARTGHEIGYLVNALKAAVEKRDLLGENQELRAHVDEMKRPRAVS